jgi:YesN/AraC family two-component response regulator
LKYGSSKQGQTPMTQPDGSPKAKLRVLIADDVQETRRNTRLMLSTLGVEVVAIASNGLQAVEMAKEHHPDIVLLDINMPEMDGLTAFKNIAQIYPDTGCIIISAENDSTTLRTAMSIGVHEYLIKPFIIEELETALERVNSRLKETREKTVQSNQLQKKTEVYLEQLADEYVKARRTDDQAMQLFEQLAENPQCKFQWLKTLALIYAIRQEWGKLKDLSARLELQTKK